jgi:hypothetical protein
MRRNAAVILLCLAETMTGLGADAAPGPRGRPADTQSVDTLHQKARRAGGRLQEILKEEAAVPSTTIRDLAANSPDIVIGQVLARRGHLAPDGRSVRTDVVLKVQQTVRGDSRPGQLITIAIPGGTFRFSDGTTARQYLEHYRPARDQERYLFFLRRSSTGLIVRGDVAYEWAVGPQGQFELNFAEDQVVPAILDRRHPIRTRYEGTSIKALLVELRAATRP